MPLLNGKLKLSILSILFVGLFLLFFFNNRYYLPSELTLNTQATGGTSAKLYWDSGIGFNDRESAEFTPYVAKKFDNKPHTVQITRLSDVNPSSAGSEVWIESILMNGSNSYDIQKAVVQGKSFMNDNQKLALEQQGSSIEIRDTFETLDIVFYSHKWAGKAQVTIDGVSQVIDLYSEATKAKSISFSNGVLPETKGNKFPLPQLHVRALKVVFSDSSAVLESGKVTSSKGTVNLTVPSSSNNGVVEFGPLKLQNSAFQPVLLVVQLITAAAVTLAVSWVWNFVVKRRQRDVKATLKCLFVEEYRWFFWLAFLVSLFAFSMWLLGQWPGIMTVDSYHYTWREIRTFEFQDITPFVYNLYIMALTQFYDSPFIIALFQITTTSILGSYILYFCYKNGARAWLVFICGALFITSVPVGIYNITIWKDIPFNTLMLFWGFLLFYLYFKKKHTHSIVDLNLFQIVLLAFSLFLLCTFRHNGMIMLVAIPAILIAFKLLSRKNLIRFIVATLSTFLVYWVTSPYVLSPNAKDVSSFFAKTYRVGPLAAIYSSKVFYSPNIQEDEKLIHKWMTDEELKLYYTPVTQADDAGYMVAKWSALQPEDQAKLNRLYFIRSLQNPHIFLADRLTMLLGSMGLSSNVFITTNELRAANGDKSAWRPIEAYKFTSDAKVNWLARVQASFVEPKSAHLGGIPLQPLLFNTIPAFLTFLIILGWYCRKTPGTAMYSFIFLYNVPFLFIVLSTCEWRYFYFLLLGIYFVFPMMSLELRSSKQSFHKRTVEME